MEVDDEDVLFQGTELQKYLNNAGYTEFKASEKTSVITNCPSKSIKKDSKYSKRPQNCTRDLNLCVTLIKIILESQLIFKEDTLFIKEFIPSEHIRQPLFFTKRNCFTFILLCITCGLLNVFFLEYCDSRVVLSMLILWSAHVFLEILFKLIQHRKIKNIVIKTIKSMEKSSLLIQKLYKFLCDCNKLYNIHNSCNATSENTNSSVYLYLLMPELKSLLLTELQNLIDCLVYNITEVHTFFPLKDSVKNIIYLYLTDCKIDLENISLENINKAKYTYYLLQSEFLKQSSLCLNPVLWTPKSYAKINNLINYIGEVEKVYSNTYNILSEEYDIYSLFKHNNIVKNNHLNNNNSIIDLKSKVYSIRQVLQNMMVHLRVMEDLIEMPSNYCNDTINATVSILVKEMTIFNELISTFQIGILKTNKEKNNEIVVSNSTINETKNNSSEKIDDPIKSVCDELFFGVSEKIAEEPNDKFFGEEIFDKSNNHNLMLELKVALKEKQIEWKQREEKLQKQHIQLIDDISDEEYCHENFFVNNKSTNNIRKVALDNEPDYNYSMQPCESLASEIACIASKWNTEIESFGDDSDYDDE